MPELRAAKAIETTAASAMPAEAATLSDAVYATLREELLTGAWLPGEKITARAVARKHGISLSPARDAMTRLANEGGLGLSATRMYSVPRLTAGDYMEATTIRLALEPMAAELAASRLTAREIVELGAINDAMRVDIRAERFQDGLMRDSRFHLGIYKACGSQLLWQMIASLWLRIGPTRNLLSPAFRRGLRGYRMHLKIVDALRLGDGATARRLIRRDLGEGAAHLAEALSSIAGANGDRVRTRHVDMHSTRSVALAGATDSLKRK